jgi:hypothetical protein
MSSPSLPGSAPPPLQGGARRGRRVAQIAFFSLLVWIIVAGSWQILAEGLFAKRVAHDEPSCRAELALLRARLADATLAPPEDAPELAAVAAFRAALGGALGRTWDIRVQELVDGCPPAESAAAYALARLRAGHEAIVRIGAQELSPARAAHRRALSPFAGPPPSSGPPAPSP